VKKYSSRWLEVVVGKRIDTNTELLLEAVKGRLGGQPISGLL
jgi:hypothetical protein